jgi:fumarylacetoacetate (FAA) hydrolase
MRLATLDNGTRDGELVVVRRDNQRFARAAAIAPTMQAALDQWDEVSPALEQLYQALNDGAHPGDGDTDGAAFHAPLPRAYEWIDGSAYINHIILVRKARNAEPPETLRTDPLVYQGGSGTFLRPTDPIAFETEDFGIDFEAEVAVILGDTPRRVSPEDALKYVRLVTVVNDVTLRNLIPAELAKGFGFFTSKPSTAFAPIALTPDELGDAWKDGRVHLPLVTRLNGDVFGDPEAGPEMHFGFAELISFLTRTRAFTAGTIVGSGTVSNEDTARGSSCLAEKRMLEQIGEGRMTTPFLRFGDRVEIEMKDRDGQPLFGPILQTVVQG